MTSDPSYLRASLSLAACLALGAATVYVATPGAVGSATPAIAPTPVAIVQPSPPPPPPQPPPPPPRTRAIGLDVAWDTLAGAAIVAHTPAGPFASLSDVCVALDRKESDDKFEGCHPSAYDELGGAGDFVRIGEVRAWEPQAHADDMPVRLEHLVVQTHKGWYVLPAFGDTGNRYSSLFFEAARAGADDSIVIQYHSDEATAGRFASRLEDGIVACNLVDGEPSCTPKIPARAYTTWLNTSVPGWPSSTHVEIACLATYAAGAVTVAPMPEPSDTFDAWTASAAASCTGVGYGGTHAVTRP